MQKAAKHYPPRTPRAANSVGPQSEVGVLTHRTIYIMTYSSLFIYSNRQLIRKPLFPKRCRRPFGVCGLMSPFLVTIYSPIFSEPETLKPCNR